MSIFLECRQKDTMHVSLQCKFVSCMSVCGASSWQRPNTSWTSTRPSIIEMAEASTASQMFPMKCPLLRLGELASTDSWLSAFPKGHLRLHASSILSHLVCNCRTLYTSAVGALHSSSQKQFFFQPPVCEVSQVCRLQYLLCDT